VQVGDAGYLKAAFPQKREPRRAEHTDLDAARIQRGEEPEVGRRCSVPDLRSDRRGQEGTSQPDTFLGSGNPLQQLFAGERQQLAGDANHFVHLPDDFGAFIG
jgi:hypothetical protein